METGGSGIIDSEDVSSKLASDEGPSISVDLDLDIKDYNDANINVNPNPDGQLYAIGDIINLEESHNDVSTPGCSNVDGSVIPITLN